jgi:hypothetical protein
MFYPKREEIAVPNCTNYSCNYICSYFLC